MNDTVKKYDAIVVERQADVVDGTSDPDLTTYTVRAINTEDSIVLTATKPNRRIATDVRIIPAEVRDPCTIQVWGDGTYTLWMDTEGIPFKDCDDIGIANVQTINDIVKRLVGQING